MGQHLLYYIKQINRLPDSMRLEQAIDYLPKEIYFQRSVRVSKVGQSFRGLRA
jgi:hypothetical protein